MTDVDLEKRIAEMSDVDLVRMLTVDAVSSDPRALTLAEAEARRRGLPIDENFIPQPEPDPVPDDDAESRKFDAGGLPVVCTHCDGELFRSREVLLNTRGLTFFGLDWLNNSVTAVRCTGCGLIQFFGEASGPGKVGSS